MDKEIEVFEGSENFRRDFIHVDDIVACHLLFINKVKESGVWNVGTGSTKSFMEVAEQFDVPIRTIPMPDKLKHSYQKYTCADITKLLETVSHL
jgi:ADP-L-glycero-D-manno-heptose 6-epimerase